MNIAIQYDLKLLRSWGRGQQLLDLRFEDRGLGRPDMSGSNSVLAINQVGDGQAENAAIPGARFFASV